MRSIRFRLLLVAVTTTMLTVAIVSMLLLLVIRLQRELYGGIVETVILAWQQRDSEFMLYEIGSNPCGYVVDTNGQILFAYLDATPACAVGARIAACIPNAEAIPPDGRTEVRAGVVWHEFRQPLRDGVTTYARVQPDLFRGVIGDLGETILPLAIIAVISSLPLALTLSIVTVRPLARRLQRIAITSRSFAAGDLDARTNEHGRDEIGQLSQQFDHMATTISEQVQDLRALAAQDSALALSAEESGRAAERAMLSRDLHDTVAQHLFSLAMGTASLATLIERDPEQAAQQAQTLATIATHAQDELRSMLTWLRPNPAAKRGLAEALDDLAQSWREHNEGATSVDLQITTEPLPLLLESVLYRVCQEALNNVARHAHAQHVVVQLARRERDVVLTVRDDGCGFDKATPVNGFGLIGMSERVRAVRGILMVTSAPEAGTELHVQIPVATIHEE